MKAFIFALILSTSVTSFAFTVESKLDLRATYGNFNAGLYQVTSELVSYDTSVEANFSQSLKRDDNDLFCVSTVSFNVGSIKTTIKNLETGASFSRVQPLIATTSIQDETEECKTTLASFAGPQDLYMSTTGTYYVMPVAAPAKYNEVRLWLTPLQTPRLKVNLIKGFKSLHLNAKGLFTLERFTTNYNKLDLTYYLQAVQGDSALSLAVGVIPMTVAK